MKFKKYINELFKKDVDITIEVNKWNKWVASFPVANDIYRVTNTRLNYRVMYNTLTDKEMRNFTGTDWSEVKKRNQQIKADREAGKGRIPINAARRKIEEFFEANPIWVIGFSSQKFGDKILNIRTREEVGTIYSGVKKIIERFIDGVRPPFVIIDAKDQKRVKIYKRFVDEIIKRAGYKSVGGKRKINYGDDSTDGWILHSGGSGSPFN